MTKKAAHILVVQVISGQRWAGQEVQYFPLSSPPFCVKYAFSSSPFSKFFVRVNFRPQPLL